MAFEYGFYNSINGDRKYNSVQISQIFDGVITDGVFASIGDKLFTTANGGMEIAVGTGKAWFNHTWNLNTTKMVFTLPHSHAVLSRYDAVVLEVNEEQDVYGRVNEIKIVYGTPSSNAIKPTMINTQYVHQHPLAYVKINAAAETITAADIEIVVGQTACPFVTSVLQQTDISDLFTNWDQQFTTWFDNLKAQLTDNVVTNLQNQIDQCLKPTDIATAADIKNGTSGKLVDASGLKSHAFDLAYPVGSILTTSAGSTITNDPILRTKWIKCEGYGKLLRKNEYPELYNAVRYNFNSLTNMWRYSVHYTRMSVGSAANLLYNTIFFKDFCVVVTNLANSRVDLRIDDQFWNYSVASFSFSYGRILSSTPHVVDMVDHGDKLTILLGTNGREYVLLQCSGVAAIQSNWTMFYGNFNNYQTHNLSSPHMRVDNDTVYVFGGYSNKLEWYSFYLDRTYNELRSRFAQTIINVDNDATLKVAGVNYEFITPNNPSTANDIHLVITTGQNNETIKILKISKQSGACQTMFNSTYSKNLPVVTFKHLSKDNSIHIERTGMFVENEKKVGHVVYIKYNTNTLTGVTAFSYSANVNDISIHSSDREIFEAYCSGNAVSASNDPRVASRYRFYSRQHDYVYVIFRHVATGAYHIAFVNDTSLNGFKNTYINFSEWYTDMSTSNIINYQYLHGSIEQDSYIVLPRMTNNNVMYVIPDFSLPTFFIISKQYDMFIKVKE